MNEFGSFWTGILDTEDNFGGLAAANVFSVYEGGLVVDIIVLSKIRMVWIMRCIRLLNRFPGLWLRLPKDVLELGQELADFFRLGVWVLFDEDRVVELLQETALAIPRASSSPPSLEEFQQSVDGFWIDPPRVVSYLQRGNPMGAMECIRPIKKQLIKMAEWHARAKNGWKNDGTWYRLRWIDRWADPHVLAAFPNIYAHYDIDDLWRALFEMMDLYQWLITEIARLLDFDYSSTVVARVTSWVEQIYAERTD